MKQCRICGRGLLEWQHHDGAVDCINAFRQEVDELRSLLPQGEQVLRAPIARDVNARLWIEGKATTEALEKLITYIRFMQEAWAQDIVQLTNVDTKEPEALEQQEVSK